MGQAVLMQLLNIFGNIYYSLTFRNHRNAIHENYIHFLVAFFASVFNQHFNTMVSMVGNRHYSKVTLPHRLFVLYGRGGR